MTAINLFRQGTSAFMLTDGALTDFDGTLIAIQNKVVGLPVQGIAICSTGYSVCDLNAEHPEGIATGSLLDALTAGGIHRDTLHHDALAIIPTVLRYLHERNLKDFGDLSDAAERSSILMTIAAWDPIDRQAKTYIAGTEQLSAVHPPYSLTRVHNYLTSPTHAVGVDVILADIGKTHADLSNPTRFDVRHDGLKLLETQRSIKGGMCGASIYGVGGCAYLTEVSAAGVTIEQLHEWSDDRVGFPIRPASEVVCG